MKSLTAKMNAWAESLGAALTHHCLAVRTDGSIVAWGNGLYGQTDMPASPISVVAVTAGQNHNLALKSDGVIVAWEADWIG